MTVALGLGARLPLDRALLGGAAPSSEQSLESRWLRSVGRAVVLEMGKGLRKSGE